MSARAEPPQPALPAQLLAWLQVACGWVAGCAVRHTACLAPFFLLPARPQACQSQTTRPAQSTNPAPHPPAHPTPLSPSCSALCSSAPCRRSDMVEYFGLKLDGYFFTGGWC